MWWILLKLFGVDRKGWYWHQFHDGLVSWCGSYWDRRDEIRTCKPENEIETRLRFFRRVKGKVPAILAVAAKTYTEAGRAYAGCPESSIGSCLVDFQKAEMDYKNAVRSCANEIEALHAKECPDCPWDGKQLVFGSRGKNDG